MKVFFAAPIRGDRSKIEINKFIVELIQNNGHEVLNNHVIKDKKKIIEIENNLGMKNVYGKDMNWLVRCDLLITEVSAPSFGAGYEVGFLSGKQSSDKTKKIQIIILYDKKLENEVSAMATGNSDKNTIVYGYKSKGDIKEFLSNYL